MREKEQPDSFVSREETIHRVAGPSELWRDRGAISPPDFVYNKSKTFYCKRPSPPPLCWIWVLRGHFLGIMMAVVKFWSSFLSNFEFFIAHVVLKLICFTWKFNHCVNFIKKLSLGHPVSILIIIAMISYFQTWHWLWVDKGLQKLQKSDKNKLRLLFQWCILIPLKCPTEMST